MDREDLLKYNGGRYDLTREGLYGNFSESPSLETAKKIYLFRMNSSRGKKDSPVIELTNLSGVSFFTRLIGVGHLEALSDNPPALFHVQRWDSSLKVLAIPFERLQRIEMLKEIRD